MVEDDKTISWLSAGCGLFSTGAKEQEGSLHKMQQNLSLDGITSLNHVRYNISHSSMTVNSGRQNEKGSKQLFCTLKMETEKRALGLSRW